MGLKVFRCGMVDIGRDWIVVTEDIQTAIKLYDKANSEPPQKIKELTAEGNYVIVEGFLEPEYNLPF